MRHTTLLLYSVALCFAGALGATLQVPPKNSTLKNYKEVWGIYPPVSSTIPQKYVLTNGTITEVAERLSLPSGERQVVIFTTLRFGDAETAEVLGMLSNFCYYLHRAGLLPHTLLITTDETTWKSLRSRGLPAYLDRAFPRRSAYVHSVLPNDTYNREFDVQKQWWGWRFSSLGYRVVYMDSDAAVLGDLMKPFSHSFGYDVQVSCCFRLKMSISAAIFLS